MSNPEGQPQDSWTWHGVLFLTVLCLIVLGIGYGLVSLVIGPRATDPPPQLFDVVALAGQPPSAVEGVLGPAVTVERITNEPEWMPGEHRDYVVPGSDLPLSIRYHNNQAVFFHAYLPTPEKTAEAALMRIGVNVQGMRPDTRAPGAMWWRQYSVAGKNLREVPTEELQATHASSTSFKRSS
jgi:hypothetical protein